MISDNLTVSENGELLFAGRSTVELLAKYGSPLYVMDEARIRARMREYAESMCAAFGESALPLYASKACSFKEIYRIASAEGIGVDVVSAGEIFTAHSAGFPMEKAYFHGNNKTDEEIRLAMEVGVGYFVVDSIDELNAVEQAAAQAGITQKILLRITPGIDTHTYEAVNTGKVDSKFGNAIETGQAANITALAMEKTHLALMGFHCHVGSQVFDSDTFFRSADIMLAFIADMKKQYGFVTRELDLGGGYGVRYTENDPTIDLADNIRQVGEHLRASCAALALEMPAVRLEPGRSIVADAGLTLYTVGTVKHIPGYKTYVTVDGGMGDNPRFALYGSAYMVLCANKMTQAADMVCDVVGKYCESGDIVQPAVSLPSSVCRSDILAVTTTGAYNYSMASNYNRIPRLPIVLLTADGGEKVVVRRETLDDLVQYDL